MQTKASRKAVQRSTPTPSRRTFWNVLKGSAVTLIKGVTLSPPTSPMHVASLYSIQLPSTSLSLLTMAPTLLGTSCWQEPQWPPLCVDLTLPDDSLLSSPLQAQLLFALRFLLISVWFTFWREGAVKTDSSFQARHGTSCWPTYEFIVLAQVWGPELIWGKQMEARDMMASHPGAEDRTIPFEGVHIWWSLGWMCWVQYRGMGTVFLFHIVTRPTPDLRNVIL